MAQLTNVLRIQRFLHSWKLKVCDMRLNIYGMKEGRKKSDIAASIHNEEQTMTTICVMLIMLPIRTDFSRDFPVICIVILLQLSRHTRRKL